MHETGIFNLGQVFDTLLNLSSICMCDFQWLHQSATAVIPGVIIPHSVNVAPIVSLQIPLHTSSSQPWLHLESFKHSNLLGNLKQSIIGAVWEFINGYPRKPSSSQGLHDLNWTRVVGLTLLEVVPYSKLGHRVTLVPICSTCRNCRYKWNFAYHNRHFAYRHWNVAYYMQHFDYSQWHFAHHKKQFAYHLLQITNWFPSRILHTAPIPHCKVIKDFQRYGDSDTIKLEYHLFLWRIPNLGRQVSSAICSHCPECSYRTFVAHSMRTMLCCTLCMTSRTPFRHVNQTLGACRENTCT